MTKDENKLALLKPSELSLVQNNALNPEQLQFILSETPQQYIKQREGKGGVKWIYVPGGYVKKVLNLMFGWDWDYEIIDMQHWLDPVNQVVCHGKLTVRTNGRVLVKHQIGSKDIVYENDYSIDPNNPNKKIKKRSNRPLDLGNDYKAAATDGLKKCAAELGIAADVYNKEEFRAVQIDMGEEDNRLKEAESQFKTEQNENKLNDNYRLPDIDL